MPEDDQPAEQKPLPPYHAAYQTWAGEPSRENMTSVIKTVEPAIQGALRSMNLAQNPLAVHKARLLAATAVHTFRPDAGVGLPTWVNRQMQPLKRFNRTNLAPVRVPERIQLDALHLFSKDQEFQDKFGREPDVEELSDLSHLPVHRIHDIRRTYKRTVSEQAIAGNGVTGTIQADSSGNSMSDEAISYVYKDADKVDRQIIEMKTGYGGKHDPMNHVEIAKQLNISPASITRRAARLSLRINKIRDALESTTGAA